MDSHDQLNLRLRNHDLGELVRSGRAAVEVRLWHLTDIDAAAERVRF